jgi:mannan endo-1,4-beta-mannosidase
MLNRKLFAALLVINCGLCVGTAQSNLAAGENEPRNLYVFADGTDTWAAAPSNAEAGTTAQSSDNAANSATSLRIDTTADGWFGPSSSSPQFPLSTSEVTKLFFDITTTSKETSLAVAVQVGSNYQWCQSAWGYIDSDQTTTITVDLSKLLTSASACGGTLPADSSDIRGIWVYFSGGGSYYLNKVRVQ